MIISNILLLVFLTGDIAICTAPEYQEQPSIAFDGNNYLVVWQDKRSGDCDIWGQFISQEGTLVDTNFPICIAENNQVDPEVCFGTGNYLVIWKANKEDTGKIYGQRVSPSGVLIDTAFTINDWGYGTNPDIAFNDTNFMVIWRDYHDLGKDQVRGRQVSQGGIPIDTSFLIPVTGSDREWPSIAFSDTNYLVVWSNTDSFHIYGSLVSTNGVPSDTVFPIIEKNESTMIIPDVASCGENYLVVTTTRDTIIGRLVSTSGTFLDNPFTISTEKIGSPSVIWTDSSYLVVWEGDISKGPTDIFGQWISKNGTLIDTTFIICDAYYYQAMPVSAYGNNNCLVVWADTRDFDYDIYGTIVSTLGVEERDCFANARNDRLEVYPNPFTEYTVIRYSEIENRNNAKIEVYDMVGRLVEEVDGNATTESLHSKIIIGEKLLPGVYFVKVRSYEPIKIIKLRRVR